VKERNSFFNGNSIPDPKLNDITAEEERRQKSESQFPKQQNSFKAFDLQPADSLGNSRLPAGAQPANVQQQPNAARDRERDIDAFKHLESPPSISEDKGSYGFNYMPRARFCGFVKNKFLSLLRNLDLSLIWYPDPYFIVRTTVLPDPHLLHVYLSRNRRLEATGLF
jgi:hypothetical protein